MKTLTVSHTGKAAGWGAVYAQYLEDMDRVKAFEGKGLQVSREYIYKGKALSAKEKLQVGDKLTVRLTLRADRGYGFRMFERRACSLYGTSAAKSQATNGPMAWDGIG